MIIWNEGLLRVRVRGNVRHDDGVERIDLDTNYGRRYF